MLHASVLMHHTGPPLPAAAAEPPLPRRPPRAGRSTSGGLSFVDLAGSERVVRTEADGARLAEAGRINRSLLALKQVCSPQTTMVHHKP